MFVYGMVWGYNIDVSGMEINVYVDAMFTFESTGLMAPNIYYYINITHFQEEKK